MLARFVTVCHSAMLWSVAAITLQKIDNRDNKFNSALNKYTKSKSGMVQLLQAQYYNILSKSFDSQCYEQLI